VIDFVGDAHGVLLGGATLSGNNDVVLDGVDDYVDFPNGLISGLTDVTLAAWVGLKGGGAYARVFDFGVGSDGENPAEGLGTTGVSFVASTHASAFFPDGLASLIASDGLNDRVFLPTDARLDAATRHVVVVVQGQQTMALFLDGVLRARVPIPQALSEIDDVNNWLGRSQFDQDPYFSGVFDDFRIYDGLLEDCAVARLFAQGPDAFDPP
jgi:hypothetical protein